MSINTLLLIITGYLGSIVGSFLYNLAIRSGKDESNLWNRSKCERCLATIHFYDLIPIFSFLLLRGKCRQCHQKFSNNYLYIEIISFLIFFSIFYLSNPLKSENLFDFFFILIVSSALLYLSIYDALYFEIQESVIWFIIICLGIFSIITFKINVLGILGIERLIAGVIGGIIFYLIVKFSKNNMGEGEIIMGILMGLIAGVYGFYYSFMIGIITATIFGLIFGYYQKLLTKQEISILKIKIPLVPFLSMGLICGIYLVKFNFKLF